MEIIERIKSITLILTLVCGILLVVSICFASYFPLLITSPLLSSLLLISAISGSIWMGLCWNDDCNNDCK